MTQHSNVSLKAARATAARGNGATVHNTSHLAAWHKQRRDLDSSAVEIAALRK